MRILFVNGSPNSEGATAALARELVGGRDYETLKLTDYRINVYGQQLPGDRFEEVLGKMKEADVLIMGSPVYWHNICGSVRSLLDRFYGSVPEGSMRGKLAFLFQGAAPQRWMNEAADYTMGRFAKLYGWEYLGMATDAAEARQMGESI